MSLHRMPPSDEKKIADVQAMSSNADFTPTEFKSCSPVVESGQGAYFSTR